MFAHGETVTRLRGMATIDAYGDEATDWNAPQSLVIVGVAFDPGGSDEPVDAGHTQRVVTSPTLYDPTYADVEAGDRIRRNLTGITYEVDGNPAEWRSPFTGWRPGQVVKLKVVDG